MIQRCPRRVDTLNAYIAVFIRIRWPECRDRRAEGLDIVCHDMTHDLRDVRVLEAIRQIEDADSNGVGIGCYGGNGHGHCKWNCRVFHGICRTPEGVVGRR